MGATNGPWYRHAGGAMLRAAVTPLHQIPATWPALSDPDSCRSWLEEVWELPWFAEATRYASTSFATLVEAVLNHKITNTRQVRRVTLSAIRYLLRSAGRPTPFGMFAGVAAVRVGDDARVSWGAAHRLMIRADTLWLDDVVERLETQPDLLAQLDVVVSDLLVARGDRIELPRGPGRVSVRNTAVVRLVKAAAATPITVRMLADKIAEAFPSVPSPKIHQTLADLVAQGILITNLRAPMTVTDPLKHVIKTLGHATASTPTDDVAAVVEQLREIHRILHAHNATQTSPGDQPPLRETATERMRHLCSAGRTTLAGDLHLHCRTTVPDALAEEMAQAVTALVRLTRQPRPDQAWNDWCREFWERYGTGAVVPVTEAVHPDAGIGWPAGFPASALAEPEDTVSGRDAALFRLAWEAVSGGRGEVVLTDEAITAITADEPVDTRWIPPHVELAARVHAASEQALRNGDYTFAVHPGQAFGTLTSRFGQTVIRAGLQATYATTPPGVNGALSVQMSFPPLFPHSENVARIPAHLPHVLPLGEHRADHGPAVVPLHDLGIVAVADGLHLVSISRRQIIEPQVFHALALGKQAPPLARFLATLTRGFWARYTEFDWGPLVAGLPYLPRVRYRRAILSPATWRITGADDAAMTSQPAVEAALRHVERHRYVPDAPLVDAYDEKAVITHTFPDGTHLSCASGPTIVAGMLHALDVHPGQRILEIGAGTGYNAALLATLTGTDGEVTTIDLNADVTADARRNLDNTGFSHVRVLTRDGAIGAAEHAPYHRVIVTVSAWDIPQAWWDQLAPGGRLVLPLRWRGTTRAVAFIKRDDHWESDWVFLCGFVPMLGQPGEQHATIDHDRLVTIHYDTDQPVDTNALYGVLAREGSAVWSDATVHAEEPFDRIWLHLSAVDDRTVRIEADPQAVASGLCTPAIATRSPALVEGGSLAYFTTRRSDHTPGQWQLGAIGHGDQGGHLAARIVDQINNWDQDRTADPHLVAYPTRTPSPPNTAGRLIVKPNIQLFLHYPGPLI